MSTSPRKKMTVMDMITTGNSQKPKAFSRAAQS